MESAPEKSARDTSNNEGSILNNAESPDPLLQPLGGADQSCKECRRRKAKCNKAMPTCGLCAKYGRHCLYEKHSKTPLTRKHLTEVEEKLERAERLLRQARLKNLLPQNSSTQAANSNSQSLPFLGLESNTKTPDLTNGEGRFDFNDFNAAVPPFASNEVFGGPTNFTDFNTGSAHREFFYLGAEDSAPSLNPRDFLPAAEDKNHPTNTLDAPPIIADDFEWDEQDIHGAEVFDDDGTAINSSHSGEDDGDSVVVDGMATLTMSEGEGGYLGVASGAALLRLIDTQAADQDTQRSKTSRGPLKRLSLARSNSLLYEQPNPNRHITDTMIDAYFRLWHMQYPIVHEPSFRAQYSELIERPNGNCWNVLAYVLAAIGVSTSGTSTNNDDMPLFAHAKGLLNINFLESGNLTLVQALTLMGNYLQKVNKPNSGYNYVGLAVRMAMGIGLHKEFSGWKIPPLKMEQRRRVWWCMSIFECGSTYTFSRPVTWPGEGVEVALPLNVNDRDLTAASQKYPEPIDSITLYTTVRVHASFNLATMPIYSKVISKPFPSARELLNLDDQVLVPWYASIPSYFGEYADIPKKHSVAHAIMMWRYRNFRIIMYRPFVIRQMLYAKQGYPDNSIDGFQAYDRCLHEAKTTIESIHRFWQSHEHSRLLAWYALYFIFQASLIPCICLRNDPNSPLTADWQQQILDTLSFIEAISLMNTTARRCHTAIAALCGNFIKSKSSTKTGDLERGEESMQPCDESPQTQMNNVYSLMWPNMPAPETDVVMQDDAWMEFLMAENGGFDGDANQAV